MFRIRVDYWFLNKGFFSSIDNDKTYIYSKPTGDYV